MARPFRGLEPREVLALAIAVEGRNAERYDAFANLFEGYDDDASRLFAQMREEEIEHGRTLSSMYATRYGSAPMDLDEEDVDDVVEAVDIDDAEHQVFDTMTSRKALGAGLRAEQAARLFYNSLLPTTRDEELRELYGRLADVEQGHVVALQRRIADLGSRKEAA